MNIAVHFYSYLKDLTGCVDATEALSEGANIGQLMDKLHQRFPRLVAMRNSTLVAVGVEYQSREYVLREGDEVSLFPPVQGG